MKQILGETRDFLVSMHPMKLLLLGYSSYILFGWVLLSLPFAQSGAGAGALDGLFISTSAVSTTGLVTVSIADSYSVFGQVVVLLLIQLGGLGYMTFSSFVILSRKRELSDTRKGISQAVFSLPRSFRIDKFVRSVMIFTVVIEGMGAAALYGVFRAAGAPNALWSAIFHSVSSFCTAGFSLYNDSFVAYQGNFWLVLTVTVLSYLGAVGFIVCVDVWRKFRGKVTHITLTSKIILHATFWVSFVGTAVFFVSEPSIQSMPADKRLMASLFQAMTAMTTVGFNTISISDVSRASLLLLTTLMVIGASPSGTGGGLKSTTFSAILGILKSTLRGETEVRFWGNLVPEERLRTAVATLCLYVTFLLLGTWCLTLTETAPFEGILFEAASALGTVGLSTGITSTLTNMGKIVLVLLMFIGRVGPLTFGTAIFLSRSTFSHRRDGDLAI